jgi:hypothetical protein
LQADRNEIEPILMSISDFLLEGPGVWYEVEGDEVLFKTGSEDPSPPVPAHTYR